MKKQTFILILFLLVNVIQAQNPLIKQWDYRYGGSDEDMFTCLQQTNDGGYILGGYTFSIGGGDKTEINQGMYDYWIVKIDALGNKQWDRDFGGTVDDKLYSIQQTTDGGYILGGYSSSDSSGNKTEHNWDTSGSSNDYWIIKTDSLGIKQWEKDFGGIQNDELFSVKQTTDGGYIIGGWSFSGINGDKTEDTWGDMDYWIIKIDSSGNKQWDRDFGGTKYDYFTSIVQTIDGGYIMCGSSFSAVGGNKTTPNWDTIPPITTDYWLIKTDSFGIKQWEKDFGGTRHDNIYSLQQTSDKGYILGGVSNSEIDGDKTQHTWGVIFGGTSDYDYWIVKTDSAGIIQWDKDFGGYQIEYDFGTVSQNADNGVILSGSSHSPISGDKTEDNMALMQTWVVKTDSSGNKIWDKTIHTVGYNSITSAVIETQDGCFVIANSTGGGPGGDKTQPSQGSIDYWIIKFCDSTLTTSINQLLNSQLAFSIFPNPAGEMLTVALNKGKKITIINLLGEIMIEKNISSVLNGKVDLDISFLSAGIYFIKIDSESDSYRIKKFVKE